MPQETRTCESASTIIPTPPPPPPLWLCDELITVSYHMDKCIHAVGLHIKFHNMHTFLSLEYDSSMDSRGSL